MVKLNRVRFRYKLEACILESNIWGFGSVSHVFSWDSAIRIGCAELRPSEWKIAQVWPKTL